MSNQKRILVSDIRHACGDTYYSRGKAYFSENRIQSFEVLRDGPLTVTFYSSIQGSRYYEQEVNLKWKQDYSSVDIDGDCSCPMEYNCKHIAAVCLQYMTFSAQGAYTSTRTPDCLSWLNNFDEPQEQQTPDREFITYILKPNKTSSIFTLDFYITKINKTGNLNKGRQTSLNNIRYSYSYNNYMQTVDEEISLLLSSLKHTYQGTPEITGNTGFIALSKILQTGRLFWLNHKNPAIQTGEERDLSFYWQQNKDKAYKLHISIEPDAEFILTDPPLYVDKQRHSMGALNSLDISYQHLQKITAIPDVPEEHVDEFSQRLTLEFPSIALPAPIKVDITEIDGVPVTPKITLFGTQINPTHYAHFIQLNFIYNDKTISAFIPEPLSVLQTEQGIVRIHRDMDAEFASVKQLLEFGFQPKELLNYRELTFLSPAENSVIDSASRWATFIQDTIPQLQKKGWIIETDDSFKITFQTAEDWHTDISEEENNDWFEMSFQVSVNGQKMPLLPLIQPVIENYSLDDLPENLSIPLANHNFINLPSSQLKPFLEIVFALFDNTSVNDNGSLTLSRFDAAALADLDTHSYGIFSINGGKKLIETGKKLKDFKGIDNILIPSGFNASLRGYQQQGLNWLQFLREYNFAGILADDMGLGKTIQTLCHLLIEKESGRLTKPCLIIAPTSLMGNWRREAERFTPDLSILTLQGADRKQHFDKIKDHDLILTTYPLLHRDKDTLLSLDYHYLILDEAQVIKNPKAQAARIVREIKTANRLCLTGTPMENHLGELWAQFDFLMPGFLGDSAFFKKAYRTPIENHGDDQQRQRLSKRLQPFMLRRTKQEGATELPAKTEIIRSIPLHDKQAALYESIRITMEKKVRDAIADKGLARSHITILDALLKLRQTCCDPRTLSLKEAQKVNESAKLDLLMEMLPEQLEEGRRILIFSQFTKMIALIETELKNRDIEYSKLTGQTKKRDEAIDRFKKGDANVFLISLKAGGVGLNLTEADTVIIFDPWWNPAAESQAADRAHRIGQDKPVFVYKLITENTVEEKILAMQEKKRALAEGIYNKGKKNASSKLSASDLSELFKPLD